LGEPVASDEFQVVARPDRSKPAGILIVEDEALIASCLCDGTPRRRSVASTPISP
jgi:hypothetical protein